MQAGIGLECQNRGKILAKSLSAAAQRHVFAFETALGDVAPPCRGMEVLRGKPWQEPSKSQVKAAFVGGAGEDQRRQGGLAPPKSHRFGLGTHQKHHGK